MHALALPAIEMALEDFGVERYIPDWALRCRRGALSEEIAIPFRPKESFVIESPEAMWGVLYVTEGSRLGGELILRQLREQASSHKAFAFLQSGRDLNLWRSFLLKLEDNRFDEGGLNVMKNKAVSTFQYYRDCCKGVSGCSVAGASV